MTSSLTLLILKQMKTTVRKPTAQTKYYEHTDIFTGQRRPAYTDTIPRPNKQKGIVHFLSLSNYRSNLIISLLQCNFLDGFDSASTV